MTRLVHTNNYNSIGNFNDNLYAVIIARRVRDSYTYIGNLVHNMNILIEEVARW